MPHRGEHLCMDPSLAVDLSYASALAADDRAKNTRRAYRNDLAALQRYLAERGQSTALPVDPLLISAFVGHQASTDPATGVPPNRISTIDRRLAGITAA